jgi:hypothetical protein
MGKGEYKTSKLEFGALETAEPKLLMDIYQFSNETRTWTLAQIILNLVEKFGENVWDIIRATSYEQGLRRAEIGYKRVKETGEDQFLPDPRICRKYIRYTGGSLGICKHFNEVYEEAPGRPGSFKLSYQIWKCPAQFVWSKMGLDHKIQTKLCTSLGNASDLAANDFYGMFIYEDQGLAKGMPTCSFIIWGPKTKEEHENWGERLPPHLKKYYHEWPWCK